MDTFSSLRRFAASSNSGFIFLQWPHPDENIQNSRPHSGKPSLKKDKWFDNMFETKHKRIHQKI